MLSGCEKKLKIQVHSIQPNAYYWISGNRNWLIESSPDGFQTSIVSQTFTVDLNVIDQFRIG